MLDCKKKFNVLWLNPNNPNTFPRGLLDALYNTGNLTTIVNDTGESVQSRLRKQMQADSLQPIDDKELTTNAKSLKPAEDQYGSEVLEEATQFLRLQVWTFSYNLTTPPLLIFSSRLKTDFNLYSLISATSMHIVFGVVSSTIVKKR